jgi:hypothetical protein
MPSRPNKRRVAKSARLIMEVIHRRVAAIRRDHAVRVARIRREQTRRSNSRSLPPPALPSIVHASTEATAALFTSAAATAVPHRQAIRTRPLPVGRQPLIQGKSYLLNIGNCVIECPACLALHWMQELSTKGTQRRPSFSTCCADGAIHLPPLLDAPPYLQHLLSRTNPSMLQIHCVG